LSEVKKGGLQEVILLLSRLTGFLGVSIGEKENEANLFIGRKFL